MSEGPAELAGSRNTVRMMATRDIYETGFDEDVRTELSANQCPECDGRVTTNAVETVCEDCGLVIDEQRIDHGPEWRAYDDEECERTGAPLTAARHNRGPVDRDRSRYRREWERTLRAEAAATRADAP